MFPLGGGSALFSIEGASNKVTINAAWVFYYWGLYDTSIVISYKAKSSASFEHRWCTKASTALGFIEWIECQDWMNWKLRCILENQMLLWPPHGIENQDASIFS